MKAAVLVALLLVAGCQNLGLRRDYVQIARQYARPDPTYQAKLTDQGAIIRVVFVRPNLPGPGVWIGNTYVSVEIDKRSGRVLSARADQ